MSQQLRENETIPRNCIELSALSYSDTQERFYDRSSAHLWISLSLWSVSWQNHHRRKSCHLPWCQIPLLNNMAGSGTAGSPLLSQLPSFSCWSLSGLSHVAWGIQDCLLLFSKCWLSKSLNSTQKRFSTQSTKQWGSHNWNTRNS